MFALDKSKAITLQISNDAFYYLKDGEDPIDEENLHEAYEIQEMFPNGFQIQDNWSIVENVHDLLEVTFIPYVEDTNDWDGCFMMVNNWVYRFKILNKSKCILSMYNEQTGDESFNDECDIEYHNNKPWIIHNADLFKGIPGTRLPLFNSKTSEVIWYKSDKAKLL